VIECRLDDVEWRRRLECREDAGHQISSWPAMEELLRRYDGCFSYPIEPPHLIVDTTRSIDELVADILQRLEEA